MAVRSEGGYSVGFDIPVSKRSMEVAQTCQRGGIPINQAWLSDLQLRLAAGEAEAKPLKFFSDLRSDIGLYLALFQAMLLDRERRPAVEDSEELLSCVVGADIDVIATVLRHGSDQWKDSSISSMTAAQAKLLRFSLISSNAACLMAERATDHSERCYALSLLRNYNLLLLSWNFPSVFNRAAESNRLGTGNLSTNIESALQISLLEFTFAVIKKLELGDRLNTLILDPGSQKALPVANGADNGPGKSSLFEQLIRFCEIGEVIARISDPETFPRSISEWDSVQDEIRRYLGKHGLLVLNERVLQAGKVYAQFAPQVFEETIDPERDRKMAVTSLVMHRYNRAVAGMEVSETFADSLKEVYRVMELGKVSPEALDYLFNEFLPTVGFEWAAFYSWDAARENLILQKSIGEDQWGFRQNISISTGGEIPRMIFEGMTSKAPGRTTKMYADKVERSHISWRFGTKKCRGALYLGYGPVLKKTSVRTITNYFTIIRQTLCDCLMIENDSSTIL